MDKTSSKITVTAVIVTFQSARTVSSALSAAKRCSDAGLLDTIVVDNGSTDATKQHLESASTWAKIILTERNNGFGKGCNIGLDHVHTPYTIFINPDAVVEPDALKTLLAFISENEKIGIVGPAIIEGELEGPKSLQITGIRPTPKSIVLSSIPLLRKTEQATPITPGSPPFRTGWVCGAVFLARTDLLRKLGGFDPRFFMYWEETDLCKRAETLGFETWAVGTAVAQHVGGASSAEDDSRIGGCIARFYYQSRYYYMTKHHGIVISALAELIEFTMLIARTCADALLGRGIKRLKPRMQARIFSTPEKI